MGPTFSDFLLHWIDLILNLKGGNVLGDLRSNFPWTERHTVNIIACPDAYILLRSFHNVNSRFYRIISIDHRQICILFQVAAISLSLQGTVININSIVGGATPGWRPVADQSWISDASDIDSELFRVVSTPQLACLFRNPIYSAGIHNCLLRSLFRSVIAKGGYGARPENSLDVRHLSRSLQAIE